MADNDQDLMELEYSGETLLPGEMPILPISEAVIFPAMMVPLVLSDANLVKLADDCLAGDKILGAFSQRELADEQEQPHIRDLQQQLRAVHHEVRGHAREQHAHEHPHEAAGQEPLSRLTGDDSAGFERVWFDR